MSHRTYLSHRRSTATSHSVGSMGLHGAAAALFVILPFKSVLGFCIVPAGGLRAIATGQAAVSHAFSGVRAHDAVPQVTQTSMMRSKSRSSPLITWQYNPTRTILSPMMMSSINDDDKGFGADLKTSRKSTKKGKNKGQVSKAGIGGRGTDGKSPSVRSGVQGPFPDNATQQQQPQSSSPEATTAR